MNFTFEDLTQAQQDEAYVRKLWYSKFVMTATGSLRSGRKELSSFFPAMRTVYSKHRTTYRSRRRGAAARRFTEEHLGNDQRHRRGDRLDYEPRERSSSRECLHLRWA